MKLEYYLAKVLYYLIFSPNAYAIYATIATAIIVHIVILICQKKWKAWTDIKKIVSWTLFILYIFYIILLIIILIYGFDLKVLFMLLFTTFFLIPEIIQKFNCLHKKSKAILKFDILPLLMISRFTFLIFFAALIITL